MAGSSTQRIVPDAFWCTTSALEMIAKKHDVLVWNICNTAHHDAMHGAFLHLPGGEGRLTDHLAACKHTVSGSAIHMVHSETGGAGHWDALRRLPAVNVDWEGARGTLRKLERDAAKCKKRSISQLLKKAKTLQLREALDTAVAEGPCWC